MLNRINDTEGNVILDVMIIENNLMHEATIDDQKYDISDEESASYDNSAIDINYCDFVDTYFNGDKPNFY